MNPVAVLFAFIILVVLAKAMSKSGLDSEDDPPTPLEQEERKRASFGYRLAKEIIVLLGLPSVFLILAGIYGVIVAESTDDRVGGALCFLAGGGLLAAVTYVRTRILPRFL